MKKARSEIAVGLFFDSVVLNEGALLPEAASTAGFLGGGCRSASRGGRLLSPQLIGLVLFLSFHNQLFDARHVAALFRRHMLGEFMMKPLGHV